MQIVIDIDDRLYNRIKYLEPKADTMLDEFMRSIQKGTPLPKGHGRLIDADALWKKWVFDAIGKQEIDEAPTIIEGSESE